MNIAIFGLGNVGSKVCNFLHKRIKTITFSKNNKFNCLSNNKKNYKNLFKKNYIFIELIGNIKLSIEIVLNCLKKKNIFITANKDLVSKYFFFLIFLFKKNNLYAYYEASVGGSLPIINLIENFYFKEKVFYLCSILNGTCNYILSNIKKFNFLKLIKISIIKGLAEKNFSNDILGIDTNYKTSIIISKFFNFNLYYYNIYLESIFNINNYIRKIFFYKKFISFFYLFNNYIFLNISLFFLNNTIIKNINNSYNFFLLNSKYTKKSFFVALGAGGLATSYSVIANFFQSFEKNILINNKCIKKKKMVCKNYICFNYFIYLNFEYNVIYFLYLFKIKFIKFYTINKIILKIKKTYYKKILFFLYFFKNKNFFINKII